MGGGGRLTGRAYGGRAAAREAIFNQKSITTAANEHVGDKRAAECQPGGGGVAGSGWVCLCVCELLLLLSLWQVNLYPEPHLAPLGHDNELFAFLGLELGLGPRPRPRPGPGTERQAERAPHCDTL